LADTVKPVAGARKVDPVYDPETSTTSGGALNYLGRGVFGSYLAKEIDGSLILTADEKLLALQNELFVSKVGIPTEVLAVPLIGDMIGGRRVINVGADPAGATWTIQLRK
jgi:hypothetical protein